MPLLNTERPDDVAAQKVQLRAQCRALRAALTPVERAQASELVSACLLEWLENQPQRTIGVFLAQPEEISLDVMIEQLLQRGYSIAAPRVDLVTQQMEFWRLDSLQTVQSGAFKVREPISNQKLTPEIVLVPGLAFDATGGRLGMGGGWYDRVLSAIPIRVGVCFEAQMVAHVPHVPHDQKVDFVATEAHWLAVRVKPAGSS